MTADTKLEGRLTELFNSTTSGRAPIDLHATAMTRVARVRQRPPVLARLRGERLGRSIGVTRLAGRVVLVGAALILLAMAAAFAAGALRSAASGTITYVSWDVSNPETYSIWSVRGDGTGDHRIATGECPSVSADGASMVFISGRLGPVKGQMTAAKGDGSDQRVLTGVDTFKGMISPDGSAVAWVKDLRPIGTVNNARLGYEDELWVSPVSGGPGVRVVARRAPNVSFSGQAWSPSGDRIAFVEKKFIFAGADGGRTVEESIWIVSANGSSLQQIATASESHDRRWLPSKHPSSISWSPDGHSLAYIRESGSDSWLTVLAADGSHEARIAAGFDGEPVWSPNGKYIAFQGIDGLTTVEILGGSTVGPQHRAPVNTTEPVQVDIGAWSPDSRHLLVIETRQLDDVGNQQAVGNQPEGEPSRLLLIDAELKGPPSLVLDRERSIGDVYRCPVTWSNR